MANARNLTRINLGGRVRLDREKARAWLGCIVAAYPEMAEDISDEAPMFSAAWHSRSDGAEWTAERLVRGAVEDGILICPEGMGVHFVCEGRSYYFAVEIGHDVATQVSLSSLGFELRQLGSPDATGVEAALSVLAEAERYANQVLDNLALLFAAHGEITPDQAARYLAQHGVPTWVPAGAAGLDDRQAEAGRLTKLATSLGVTELDLDEYVHDLASKPASDINNSGLPGQIAYLVREAGPAEAERIIREAAAPVEESRA